MRWADVPGGSLKGLGCSPPDRKAPRGTSTAASAKALLPRLRSRWLQRELRPLAAVSGRSTAAESSLAIIERQK